MKYLRTALDGVWLIDPEPHADERGYFMRIFCETELAEQGIPHHCAQASLSHNLRAGTIRGLHFQWPPSGEDKLVRCVAGSVFDVIVDLRPHSATFARHLIVELSAENGRAVFIPHGCAHGFQSLVNGATVLYQMDEAYRPGLDGGFRYDDPAFAIEWPLAPTLISSRDRSAPPFDGEAYRAEHARRAAAAAGAAEP